MLVRSKIPVPRQWVSGPIMTGISNLRGQASVDDAELCRALYVRLRGLAPLLVTVYVKENFVARCIKRRRDRRSVMPLLLKGGGDRRSPGFDPHTSLHSGKRHSPVPIAHYKKHSSIATFYELGIMFCLFV